MLQPTRLKYRKQQKGRNTGIATRGNKVSFGEFGLKAVGRGRLTARQIEAARRTMTRHIKRGGRIWIRVFPDKPITEKPIQVRISGGKGNVEYYIAEIKLLLSGVMGGIAGSFYSIGYLGMFADNIIGGRGWIAFAICFLGNWNPKGALVGTVVFGLAEALAIYMQSLGGQSFFPNKLFIALPYLLTIALTITRRSFNVSAKLGEPYIKEN